jgi:hypothetical protein
MKPTPHNNIRIAQRAAPRRAGPLAPSRLGSRRSGRCGHVLAFFVFAATLLVAPAAALAQPAQADSPTFTLDTRFDYQVGLGSADSNPFSLDTRFSGGTGEAMSGLFTLDTRPTAGVMASLNGRVSDATGTPLGGASILALQGTAAVSGRADDTGHYALPALEPGAWQIWVSLAGYRTWVQSGVALAPGQALALDFALAPTPTLPPATPVDRPVPASQQATIVTPSTDALMVFNGTAFASGGPVDVTLPTVIFTHGWNAGPNDPGGWPLTMAAQMQSAGVKANLLAWDWHQDAATPEPVSAMSRTRLQGEALGQALAATLGNPYAGTLHFIGHSLGTMVNAAAANYLHETVQPNFPSDHTQVTLLDDAGAATTAGQVITFDYSVSGIPGSIASQVVQAGYVSPIPDGFAWMDNYISLVGAYHPEAVNVYLPKSLGAGDGAAMHAYACGWYASSVGSAGSQALVGERYGFERTGWPGQFPTPVPFPLGTSLSQDPSSGNELDLVRLDSETDRQMVEGQIRSYIPSATVLWGVDTGVDWTGAQLQQAGSAVTTWAESVFHFTPAASFSPAPGESTGSFLPVSPHLDLNVASSTPQHLAGGGTRVTKSDSTPTYSPPAVWMTLTLPAEVRGMSFDFTLTRSGTNDSYLAFGINGTNQFALETRFMAPGRPTSSGWIDVSAYAGRTVEFFFGVLGGVSTNESVAVDGLRFYQVEAPSLQVQTSGDSVVITWPLSAGGYLLETSDNLAAVNSWVTVTNSPVIAGFQNAVTIEVSAGSRFFRLRKP